jgi:hypothetical protein
MDVIKILPPLIIGEKEIAHFVNALDAVLQECRTFPARSGSRCKFPQAIDEAPPKENAPAVA